MAVVGDFPGGWPSRRSGGCWLKTYWPAIAYYLGTALGLLAWLISAALLIWMLLFRPASAAHAQAPWQSKAGETEIVPSRTANSKTSR